MTNDIIDRPCPTEGDELALEAAAGELAAPADPRFSRLTSSPRTF